MSNYPEILRTTPVSMGLPTKPQLSPEQQFILKNQATATSPEDGIPFYITAIAGGVLVPATGVLTDVATYVVQEGQRGYLKLVGLSVEPATAFGDVEWQLYVNTSAVPNFGNNAGVGSFLTVAINTMSQPFPFQVRINPKDTLTIKARNNGLGDVTCFAVLDGWTFPINRV